MDNTAQNNGINLSYPTFSDGSTPQPNTSVVQNQPGDMGVGGFGGINTLPTGAVKSSLDDIMPDIKKPKAMERAPKKNSLAEPMINKVDNKNDYLIPQAEEEEVQPQVLDLGSTPTPQVAPVDISIPEVNIPSVQSNTVLESPNMNTTNPQNQEVGIDNKSKISQLLEYTIEKGASDLHISAGYPPIVRIDGELQEVNDQIVDPVEAEELILPLITDDKREQLEVNKEIDFAYSHQEKYAGRFRVNAYYSMKNLSAAFRLIPTRVRTIEELKLPQIYHQFTQLRQGMILVTGPTGHGKSTTLAAMLEDINRNRFSHIVTIEDPIEYIFEGKKSLIDQREMGQDTHSWPIALKSAMRQDPDVILVGEMRDYETISSAITLAETGHLVFATLHTNNCAQSIDRMIDVFPEVQQSQIRTQLSNILQTVVSQRLIPLDQGGRRAVAEILIVNPAVSNLIRERKTHQIDNVIRTSADIGMVSLERSLVDLVREGVISISTAQEYAVYPEEVARLLKS
jgi:twitching motility protein PilT